MRLSLLKYNYRMAKATKRLNAILDYMKKVKSSMSMVSLPPSPFILICALASENRPYS